MRKIKILVDAHVFDDYYQGTTTYIKGIYNELVLDDNFEILLAGSNIELLKKHFSDFRFRFIQIPKTSSWKRILFHFPEIIRDNQIDYAHFQYVLPPFLKTKSIVTVHDVLFLDFPEYFPKLYRIVRKFLFSWSAKRATILCTVSNYSQKAISRHFHIPIKRIIITPNAVNLFIDDSVRKRERPMKDKYLLFVSRMEPRKNHLSLLKAFVELKLYTGYFLVFIGKTEIKVAPYEAYLTGLSAEIKSRVIHLENVTEDDLINWYIHSEVFVYPSIAEGFGIPPLEALVCGAKVICSNSTAMSDFKFLQNYQFDPFNINSLKDSLTGILQTDFPHQSLIDFVYSNYSWRTIAKNLSLSIIDDFKKQN